MKTIFLLVFLLFLGSLNAETWQPFGNAYNGINVSVNNWHYVGHYDNANFIENNASFVMVKLNPTLAGGQSLGDPRFFVVRGYNNKTFIGNISYYLVGQYGQNSIILFKSTTDIGNRWDLATIFFNYVQPSSVISEISTQCNNPNICNLVKIFSTYANINGSAKYFNYSSPVLFQNNCITAQLLGSIGNCFSLEPSKFYNSTDVVVVADHSLTNENFNITAYPDTSTSYKVANSQGQYSLADLGFLGSTLYVGNSNSLNAQTIFFNSNPDFEFYMSIPPFSSNKIESERFSVNSTFISNQAVMKPVSIINIFGIILGTLGLQQNIDRFNLQIRTTNAINFMVLPAFTTNYTLGNVFSNSNPTGIPVINDFQTHVHISNITWEYNITSNASQNWLPCGNTQPNTCRLAYHTANVPFLKVSLPRYYGMGVSCQGIYVNNSDNNLNDPIPYSPIGCSPSNVILIIQNTTKNGYVFNDLDIWYNSPNGIRGNPSGSVLSNYYLARQGTGQISSNVFSIGNFPYEFQLSGVLTPKSSIYGSDNQANVFYDGAIGIRDGTAIIRDYATKSYQTSETRWLIATAPSDPTHWIMVSKNLSGDTANINGHTGVCNAITCVSGTGGGTLPIYSSFILYNGITANIVKLYSVNYTASLPIQRPYSANNNQTLPSSGGFNYNATTTINFLKNLNTTIVLAPNISFQKWEIGLLYLIIILFFAFTIHIHNRIGAWVAIFVTWFLNIASSMGIFGLFVGVIFTIIGILWEYSEHRGKGDVDRARISSG